MIAISSEHRLSCWERWGSGGIGVVILSTLFGIWGGCLEHEVPELLSGAGVLLILFAINGRRLSSFKLPGGVEATMEVDAKAAQKSLKENQEALRTDDKTAQNGDAAAEQAGPDDIVNGSDGTSPAAKAEDTVEIDGEEYDLYTFDSVPIRVVGDVLKGVATSKDFSPSANTPLQGLIDDVEFVARRSGKGNHSWFFKFSGKDGLWKLSYGGQAKKREPTFQIAKAAQE